MSTQIDKAMERYCHGITNERLQSFKDKLKEGDIITLTEQDPFEISERRQVEYKIVAKHKHVFTAQRINRRGKPVTISMSYIKYMIEGQEALARAFTR